MKRESIRTVEQVSAGGVAYRGSSDSVEVALVRTASEGRWQLPKGIIDPGETPEQAALREVREEAGITCEILARIDTIEYWFTASYDGTRRRYHKKVHFFLMNYVEGSADDHDNEVLEARWVEISDAVKMLAFDSEKELVRKAQTLIDIR